MKSKSLTIYVISAVCFLLLTSPQPTFADNLSREMQELRVVLEELLPMAIQRGHFSSDKQRKRYRKALEKFDKLTHRITKPKTTNTERQKTLDPSLAIIGDQLRSETGRALSQLDIGHELNSKRLVRETTSYCIACHTSSGMGNVFSAAGVRRITKNMDVFEQAQFLTATRRFDAASDLYKKIIANEKLAQKSSIAWHDAIIQALTVAVRFRNSPKDTEAVINRAMKSKSVATYFNRDLVAWKESVDQWKKEKTNVTPTAKDHVKKVKALLEKAKLKKNYPADNVATIDYLRATAAAHEAITLYPGSAYTPQLFLYLAIGYRALDDLGIWSLHELYLQRCIQLAPGTETGRRCFEHYEESIYEGYSGSQGTNIPDEVQQQLKRLAEQAQKIRKP